jgi:toxin YoeB
MAKRVVWTNTAKKARQEILEYWIAHNRTKTYSKKLSQLFRERIGLLKSQHYIGKPTDYDKVRATLVSHFTIFYKATGTEIIIVGLWDNRRNPDDLRKNLEY